MISFKKNHNRKRNESRPNIPSRTEAVRSDRASDLDSYLGHRIAAVNRHRAFKIIRDKNCSYNQKDKVISFIERHPARFTNIDDVFIARIIAVFSWNRKDRQ